MTHSLEGSVALVTGAAKRVGRAVALKLAQAGMDVALTYHTSEAEALEVRDAITAMGRRAIAIAADLGEPGAAERVRSTFDRQFNRLDALVNNAAIFAALPLAEIGAADFDRYMAVNARAPMLLIKAFAPLLAKSGHGGRVINFVDTHVLGQPLVHHAAYNASKAALLEITRSLAVELAPRIMVNAIAPGVVAWAESFTEGQKEAYLKRVPLERAGTAEDAAAAVLFLVRDAEYCTGQVMRIDGGRSLV
jgi:pteridine reductase